MAIRFQCPACSQPIEVDDPWAGKAVICPYCRKTVTAPQESTLRDFSEIPVAAPVGGRFAPPPPPVFGTEAVLEQATNPPAVAAIVLACLVVVLMFVSLLIVQPDSLELLELQKAARESKSLFEATERFLDSRGGAVPVWFVAAGLVQMAAMGLLLAGIVFGVLGLRRLHQRHLAVIALVICGAVLFLNCIGTFMV
jgi:hypothetical protein